MLLRRFGFHRFGKQKQTVRAIQNLPAVFTTAVVAYGVPCTFDIGSAR